MSGTKNQIALRGLPDEGSPLQPDLPVPRFARSLVYANSDVLCLPDLFLIVKRPMPAKAFFDTNVLIYAVAHDDPRSSQAEEPLASGGVLSVQILNEFASGARRKILMS